MNVNSWVSIFMCTLTNWVLVWVKNIRQVRMDKQCDSRSRKGGPAVGAEKCTLRMKYNITQCGKMYFAQPHHSVQCSRG